LEKNYTNLDTDVSLHLASVQLSIEYHAEKKHLKVGSKSQNSIISSFQKIYFDTVKTFSGILATPDCKVFKF